MDFNSVKNITITDDNNEELELLDLVVNGVTVWSKCVPASVSLSVDRSVICTGETATLSALVLNEEGVPCVGVPVSFSSDITNTGSLGNTITNNGGIATMEYTGEANGDIVFTATVDSLTDNVLVEDCIAYKLEEYSKTAPNTTEVDYPVGLDWNSDAFIVEFEMNTTGAGISFVVRNTTTTKNTNIGIGASGYRSVWGNYCTGNFSQSWPYNTWNTMKVVIAPSDFKFYLNNALIRECTNVTDTDGDWYFAVRGWNTGRVIKVRNIRVKPKA